MLLLTNTTAREVGAAGWIARKLSSSVLGNIRVALSRGADHPVYAAHLVEADMNEACVEVGGWLVRIGNGWQHLQVLLNALSYEVDAAIMPMLLHMLKACQRYCTCCCTC